MLKKTFEYEDYEGNKIKQDEYFHLSEAELTEMALSEKGGLDKLLPVSYTHLTLPTNREV